MALSLKFLTLDIKNIYLKNPCESVPLSFGENRCEIKVRYVTFFFTFLYIGDEKKSDISDLRRGLLGFSKILIFSISAINIA